MNVLDLGHGVVAEKNKRLQRQSSPEQQSRKSLSSTGRSERAAPSGESSATDTAPSLSNTPQTEPLTRRRSIAKPSPFGKVCVAAPKETKNRENYSHTRHFQQSQQRLLEEPRCFQKNNAKKNWQSELIVKEETHRVSDEARSASIVYYRLRRFGAPSSSEDYKMALRESFSK